MRMLGGDSTGEAPGLATANRVRNALREAACPAEEAPPASLAALGGWLVVKDGCLSYCNGIDVVGCTCRRHGCALPGRRNMLRQLGHHC